MDILLIAATGAEIAPLIKHIAPGGFTADSGLVQYKGHSIEIAITGVGMLSTAYNITKLLATKKYDLAIQAGVGGSYNRNIPLGTVVFVQEEEIGGWGAEDGDEFISIFGLGLADMDAPPFTNGRLVSNHSMNLPTVTGVTVNTVTGRDETANLMSERHGAIVESMEGAAFHYVCLAEGQPFAQVRAISNYVERRNRAAWQMGLAIGYLNDFLVEYLDQLQS